MVIDKKGKISMTKQLPRYCEINRNMKFRASSSLIQARRYERSQIIVDTEPPENTQWIMSRFDLPLRRSNAQFRITKANGVSENITLNNRKRQMLQALMRSPVYCASPVRLSDIVFRLWRENAINIETQLYQDHDFDENIRYGIYVLTDQVRYLGEARSMERDDTSFGVEA